MGYGTEWRDHIDALWPPIQSEGVAQSSDRLSAQFGLCHIGGGTHCVVDGDTFWFQGKKYRIADIDAPETHPPRCASEADLGARATKRLQLLLNAGPFSLESDDRDSDRYGRALRVVTRGGASIGEILVDEGLARPWGGRREPWC
jgi:endonuclease YncB( thermonuclease family)